MDLETLKRTVDYAKARHDEAKEALAAHDRARPQLADQAADAARFHEVMTGLATGWRDEDPGKYRTAWYFIRATKKTGCRVDEYEPMWAVEFADDPAAITQHRHSHHDYSRDKLGLAPALHGPLQDACVQHCPLCDELCLVVASYEQTDDDPDGNDTWEECLHVLCPTCQMLTVLAKYRHGYRFQSFCQKD